MADIDPEDIVNRFAQSLEDYNIDETEEIPKFGCSPEQAHELRLCFDIVSEGKDSITEDQISDVFLGLGFTLQDEDIETIKSNCTRDENGHFSCETILEGFFLMF